MYITNVNNNMDYNNSKNKYLGFSVRCVRDA